MTASRQTVTFTRIKGTKVECKCLKRDLAGPQAAGIKGTKVECKYFGQGWEYARGCKN